MARNGETRLLLELQSRRREMAKMAVLLEEQAQEHDDIAASLKALYHPEGEEGEVAGCDHCIELAVAKRLRKEIPDWLTPKDLNEARVALGGTIIILSA